MTRGEQSRRPAIPAPPILRQLGVQAAILTSATVLAWFWQETIAGSVFLGGLAYLVPQSWFAWQAFRYRGARHAQRAVQAFYRGEAGKYILTAVIFAVVFATVRPVDAIALFGAYLGMTVSGIALLSRRSS